MTDDDRIHLGPGLVKITGDGPDSSPIRMVIGDAEYQFTADAAMRVAIQIASEVAAHTERGNAPLGIKSS